MKPLPLTQKDYSNTVLVSDFICKMRNAFLTHNITDFCFSPQVNGYKILYKYNGENITVKIKFRKFFNGIKIQTTKTFCSKTADDNTAVINEII